MARVWSIQLSTSEQAVMLCLADYANDDGTSIYPSVPRIAWKTGMSVRNVQYIMRSLEQRELLACVTDRRGGRGHTAHYTMHLEKGAVKPPFREPERVQPIAPITAKGCKMRHERVQPIAPESSDNHQILNHHSPAHTRAKPAEVAPLAPLWEVAKDEMHTQPETDLEYEGWKRALWAIHRAGGTPEDLRTAFTTYRRIWPAAQLSVAAIAKHWSTLRKGMSRERIELDESQKRAAQQQRRVAEGEASRQAQQQSEEFKRLYAEILNTPGD